MTKAEMCDGIVNHIPFALHRIAGTHRGAALEPLCAPSAQEPSAGSGIIN